MEREKMIEKLASLIANNDCGKHHDCSTCAEKDYMFCQYQHLAVRLYDCGVKVVLDGAVVLTKEQQIEDIKANTVYVDKERENARKETAREILQDIFSDKNCIGGGLYELTPRDKKILCEKYGLKNTKEILVI